MIFIDFSQYCITTLMSELNGRTDIDINMSVCRNLWLRGLLELKKKYSQRFGDLVICVDGKDYWRRKVFPHYKITRKQSKLDSGYDWPKIKECMNTMQDELNLFFPYRVVGHDYAEADDVIAILAKWSQTNDMSVSGLFEETKDSVIISSDEDFVQLSEYRNIKQISLMTRKQVTIDIPLDRFCLEHILKGDGTDSVMNILTDDNFFFDKINNPDVKYKQKPVTKTIQNFYYEQWKVDGKITEWMKPEHEKHFKRNEQLVLFSKIPDRVEKYVLKNFLALQPKDRTHLLNYFMEHRLNNLIGDIQDF